MSKIDTVQRKYSELLAEMKRTEREHIKAKKRGDQLQKDKDTQRSELNKATTMKEKLEKLSRELTKENKKLKVRQLDHQNARNKRSIHLRRIFVISKKARPTRTKSYTRGSIHSSLRLNLLSLINRFKNGHGAIWRKTRCQYSEMAYGVFPSAHFCRFREKFKSFVEQYEMREIQFHSLLRTKDLEIQYQIARHEQLRKAQETEMSKSHQLTRQVSTFSQTENELRSQLNIYVEKFKQVSLRFHDFTSATRCSSVVLCVSSTH